MKYVKLWALFIMMCLIVSFLAMPVHAAGSVGMTYETFAAGGSSPSTSNRTRLSTGITTSVNYNWGSGNVLDSGRADGVIIHLTGYYKVDTTGTYNFGISSDDGTVLTINGTVIVNYWGEQGPTLRTGSVYLTAGTVVPVDIWYYENGGGAVLQFYWYNGGWQIVPSASLATASTFWQPALCCGGSASIFAINATYQNKINTFVSRTTSDSQVNIEQIGNQNTTIVNQTGTKNNKANLTINGSSNQTTVTQSGNDSTVANYSELWILGNSNAVTMIQNSTGGSKSMFVTVNDSNNLVNLQQKDSGSQYASVSLSGGNKTVSILQQGSGNHMASVSLSGNPSSLNLTQSGSTQQFYSITHNCATAGGCAAITVTQGQ